MVSGSGELQSGPRYLDYFFDLASVREFGSKGESASHYPAPKLPCYGYNPANFLQISSVHLNYNPSNAYQLTQISQQLFHLQFRQLLSRSYHCWLSMIFQSYMPMGEAILWGGNVPFVGVFQTFTSQNRVTGTSGIFAVRKNQMLISLQAIVSKTVLQVELVKISSDPIVWSCKAIMQPHQNE